MFDHMQAKWAPPDHAVFQLVPPQFAAVMERLYGVLGSPVVDDKTFWNVFQAMHAAMVQEVVVDFLQDDLQTRERVEEEEMEELGGLQEMRLGGHGPHGLYAGGVPQPTVPARAKEMYERRESGGRREAGGGRREAGGEMWRA